MDRRDYYYKQQVTDAELDAGFDGSENADRNIVGDLGFIGVAVGLGVAQHAPTPDISVDVAAGTAYDPSGRRMRVPALQTVSLTSDSNGVSTAVVNSGQSKILGVFLKFKRLNSDPRTDGNGSPVNFVQAEHYEFVVVQGAESVSPTAPATPADTIRLADVTRTFGQTQILDAQIATTNRQHAFEASAGALSVRKGTAEEAVQELLTLLNGHVVQAAGAHAAIAIAYAGGGSWASGSSPTNPATTVGAQLTKIIADLAATTASASGARRIGMDAYASTWATGVAPANQGNVWGNFDRIVQELAAATTPGGAARIGFFPAGGILATTVAAALAELGTGKAGLTAATNTFSGTVGFSASAAASLLHRVITLTDASSTFTAYADEYRFPNVTAARTYTLNAPTLEGKRVRFTKVGTGSFAITVARAAGGNIFVIPGGNDPYYVDLIAVGGVWKVSAAGAWAGVFSSIDATV